MEIKMSRVVRYQVKRDGKTRTVVEIKEPILSMPNPNSDIFDIGVEEGGDTEDNMLSMIGDATQKHVDSLCVKDRLVWESMHHFPNGSIRRREQDNRFHDRDEFNLRGEDLDAFFDNYPDLPVGMRPVYEEAIQNEKDRREEVQVGSADDIYNNNNGMVSFDEWEQNPQMMNHVDIPSTPRDIFIYVGETRQPFYDEFPEDHPDARILNQFLQLVNRDADEFNDKFVEFLRKFSDTNAMRDHTRKVLHKVCDHLGSTNNHEKLITSALLALDRQWGKAYREKALGKALVDPMVKLMNIKRDEFESLKEKGINPVQQVKAFGSTLFTKFRDRLSSHHWHLYRQMKNTYQMQVFIRGVEVNTASLEELRKVFDDKKARAVWCARPFQTAVELYVKGFVSRSQLTSSTTADKVLDFIVSTSEKKDLSAFNALAARLVAKQKDNLKLDEESWKNIWAFYKMTKKSLIQEVNKNGRGQEQLRVGSLRYQVNQASG